MTKAELMASVEKLETELATLRTQRRILDEDCSKHESEIEALWGELRALGVTKARPRKAANEAPAPAKRRGAKAEEKKEV